MCLRPRWAPLGPIFQNSVFSLLLNIISAPGALLLKNTLFLKTIKIPREYVHYCVPCHHALSPGVDEFGDQAPPLDPPMSCTLPQGHPRELPRAKQTLPRAPGTLPQGSQGPLGTSEMSKVNHQKPAKYAHLASKGHEKLIFCICSMLMCPTEALPSARTRPPKPPKGHQRTLPSGSRTPNMCLRPRWAPLGPIFQNSVHEGLRQTPPKAPPRTPGDPHTQKNCVLLKVKLNFCKKSISNIKDLIILQYINNT